MTSYARDGAQESNRPEMACEHLFALGAKICAS